MPNHRKRGVEANAKRSDASALKHHSKMMPHKSADLNVVSLAVGGGAAGLIMNPSVGGNPERAVGIPGILGLTTEFPTVRSAMMDGIIETSVPEHKQSGIHGAAPSKTQSELGMRKIPGTTY